MLGFDANYRNDYQDDEFNRCPGCGQIYWKGSHYERMMELVAKFTGNKGGNELPQELLFAFVPIDNSNIIIYKSVFRNQDYAVSILFCGNDVYAHGHGLGSNRTPDGASLSV
jgi:hypothetical protein